MRGFRNYDHALFLKNNGNKLLVASLYVDNWIYTRNDEQMHAEFKLSMHKEFKMINFGIRLSTKWDNNLLEFEKAMDCYTLIYKDRICRRHCAWVNGFLKEIGAKHCNWIDITCDNNSTIKLLKNSTIYRMTSHWY